MYKNDKNFPTKWGVFEGNQSLSPFPPAFFGPKTDAKCLKAGWKCLEMGSKGQVPLRVWAEPKKRAFRPLGICCIHHFFTLLPYCLWG